MPLTRRQFLRRTGLGAAGTLLGPSVFSNLLVRNAFAQTLGDRYLVILFLDGGNDGVNTVVPYDDVGGLRTAYQEARMTGSGGLRIPSGALAVPSQSFIDPNTGTQLGFHPGLEGSNGGIKQLYDLGKVAVIQGCGYPEFSLSHEESQGIWQSANPLGFGSYDSSGWAGRHLAQEYGPFDLPAINIGRSLAGELRQVGTSVLSVRRFKRFSFPYDLLLLDSETELTAKRNAFAALYSAAAESPQSALSYMGGSGGATLKATESYGQIHELYKADRATWSELYSALDRGTARDLREVAKVIYAVQANGFPPADADAPQARFFQVRNGGYDTHSDQGGEDANGQHYDLLAEVSDALAVFYADLDDMGVIDKVCVLVWSEFSRRIPQNENGTDHGSQGPMFILGGSVNGGIYGNHPEITDLDEDGNTRYSQDAGDGFRSTDFRDVYGTVLKHWLNLSDPDILSSVLPLDIGFPASDYWTVPDFDLGFLS